MTGSLQTTITRLFGGLAVAAVPALVLSARAIEPAPSWAPAAASQPEPAPQQPGEAPEADTPDQSFERPEATVYLKSGQRLTGLLIDDTAAGLVLRIGTLDTTIAADRIDRYVLLPSLRERYEEMRDSIGDDPGQLRALAEWLRSKRQQELALVEVQRALAIEPASEDGKRLLVLIEQELKLKHRARPGWRPAPSAPAEPDRQAGDGDTFPLLTPSQINLIKVYEVDLSDPPRMVIGRDTITAMLEKHKGDPLIPVTQEGREAIYRWDQARVLELMFRLRARDLYERVEVLDLPGSIKAFRDDVHATWLINSCATNMCHGGEEAGRFYLYNRRSRADASVFTNLLILERFRLPDGRPLIDHDRPERSPLLHMALPRGDSLFPHPQVLRGVSLRDAWRPVFQSADDRRFRRAVAWLRSMYLPRPEYPIAYEPPSRGSGATASRPAEPPR